MNNHSRWDIFYSTHELNLPPEFQDFCVLTSYVNSLSVHIHCIKFSLQISGGKLNTVDFRMK